MCSALAHVHSEVNMHHETPTQYMDKHHLQCTILLCITSCYSHLSMIFNYKYYGNGIALIKKRSVLKPCSNYM